MFRPPPLCDYQKKKTEINGIPVVSVFFLVLHGKMCKRTIRIWQGTVTRQTPAVSAVVVGMRRRAAVYPGHGRSFASR